MCDEMEERRSWGEEEDIAQKCLSYIKRVNTVISPVSDTGTEFDCLRSPNEGVGNQVQVIVIKFKI
jgi:hypothetical protein